MSDSIDKALDDLPNGKANLRVHLVVPQTGDNPWRTQGDYRQDQKRQIHLYIMQAVTLVVAVAGLLLSSYFQYQASTEKQKIEVQCIASPAHQQSEASGSSLHRTPSTPLKSAPPQQKEVP